MFAIVEVKLPTALPEQKEVMEIGVQPFLKTDAPVRQRRSVPFAPGIMMNPAVRRQRFPSAPMSNNAAIAG